jgi:phosphomannomutase
MTYEGLMVGVSGVRGRVGEALTPEIMAKFAAGFGAWAMARADGKARIVVGRDSRVSGPMFQPVVHAALQSVGCDVIDIGMVPTPTVQLAVEHHHAAGGLAITASHNPIEWNALKFIGPSGLFLDAAEGAAMRQVVEGNIPRATWDKLGTVTQDKDAARAHIEKILALPFLDVEGIRKREFRVALDCVRGAGGVFMPVLLELLGCKLATINMEPDGRFPRPPEPVAENLGELEKLVVDSHCDIGMAVDPDVDRLALVSEEGKAIGEDYTLALAAKVVLRHRKGVVVTNLSTSRIVDDIATEAGTRVILAPVGEVNVATRMRTEKAPIGGEGNGGVILEEGKPLSKIIAAYPRYVIVKDKLDRPNAPLDAVYEALMRAFPDAEADTQDGLRLTWPDRWVHIRPSGTEPIVRVIAEAPTASEAQKLVHDCRQPVEALGR